MRGLKGFRTEQKEDGWYFSLSDENGILLESYPNKNRQWCRIHMRQVTALAVKHRVVYSVQPEAVILENNEEGFRLVFTDNQKHMLAFTRRYTDEADCIGGMDVIAGYAPD